MPSQKQFEQWIQRRLKEPFQNQNLNSLSTIDAKAIQMGRSSNDQVEAEIVSKLSQQDSFEERDREDTDVFVLTALQEEFNAVEKAFETNLEQTWKKEFIDNIVFKSANFKSADKSNSSVRIVTARQDQMGMTSTAIATTKAIHIFRPKYVILAGICAAVKTSDCNLADVVVADKVFDYGSGKIKNGKLLPEFRHRSIDSSTDALLAEFSADQSYIDLCRREWPDNANQPKTVSKARKGAMASGAAVVSDESVVNAITDHERKLLAIDMEAYGLAHAAEMSSHRPKWFVVKAVTDFADETKNDQVHSYAAYLSARFITGFIFRYSGQMGIHR